MQEFNLMKALTELRNIVRFSTKQEFASYTTEQGVEVKIDGDIAQGSKVSVMDETGNEVSAPDGVHILQGIAEITVKDGLITEVKPLAEEETPQDDSVSEPKAEIEIEMGKMKEKMAELETSIADVIDQLKTMASASQKMSEVITHLSTMPLGETKAPQKHTAIKPKADRFAKMKELSETLKQLNTK